MKNNTASFVVSFEVNKDFIDLLAQHYMQQTYKHYQELFGQTANPLQVFEVAKDFLYSDHKEYLAQNAESFFSFLIKELPYTKASIIHNESNSTYN